MSRNNLLFWAVLLIFIQLSFSDGEFFFYTIPRRTTHCFEENLPPDMPVHAGFYITENGPVMIRAWAPHRMAISSNNLTKFNEPVFVEFNTTGGGNYKICLEGLGRGPTEVGVTLLFGMDAEIFEEEEGMKKREENKTQSISATSVIPVQRQMDRVGRLTEQLHQELKFLRQKEEAMRDANQSSSTKIVLFGMGTLLILASASFLQAFYLKKFFKAKKII